MLKEAADSFERFIPTSIVKRSVSILHPPPPPPPPYNINYCWTKHPSPQTHNKATIHAHHGHHKHYLDHSIKGLRQGSTAGPNNNKAL
jgi:hypothetical protein